jgi:small subunit ribosomal protein S5
MSINSSEPELSEKVVQIRRLSKVVKGGRRFSFSAVVAVGDGNGKVGGGMGKAKEVPLAIQKGVEHAKKSLIKVPIINNTISHEIVGRFGSSKVLLKPASEGVGIIAGSSVRAVVELAGIPNILTKSMGSNNPFNVVKATIRGLGQLRSPEEIAEKRGKKVAEIL